MSITRKPPPEPLKKVDRQNAAQGLSAELGRTSGEGTSGGTEDKMSRNSTKRLLREQKNGRDREKKREKKI